MNPIFFAFFILFSLSNMLVYADSTEEYEFELREGNRFFELEKFNEAISYFEKVLEVDQDNVEALAKKGDSLVELGKFDEAWSYYDKVIRIQPYRNDTSGAYYLDKLLRIDPNHVEALYKRGTTLSFFVNQIENALWYFNKALEIEPNRYDLLTSKGLALYNSNKTEEAISYYDKALEINPGYIYALNGKGEALTKLEKFDEAFSYFDKSLEIDPDNFETLLKKGDAFRASKDFYEAFSYFYKVLQMKPNNYVAINKIKVAHIHLNYTDLDGFIETIVRDQNGNLVSHLKINHIQVLDHEIAKNIINEWNFTKKINRDGVDYNVLQHERIRDETERTYHGGATHFGLYLLPEERKIGIISADYWFYEVDKGDQSSVVITALLPIT